MIALARAEENVVETHVKNVLGVHEAVSDEVPLERVLEIYPSIPSDIATKAFRQVADWDATITKAQQILAAQALPSSPG